MIYHKISKNQTMTKGQLSFSQCTRGLNVLYPFPQYREHPVIKNLLFANFKFALKDRESSPRLIFFLTNNFSVNPRMYPNTLPKFLPCTFTRYSNFEIILVLIKHCMSRLVFFFIDCWFELKKLPSIINNSDEIVALFPNYL